MIIANILSRHKGRVQPSPGQQLGLKHLPFLPLPTEQPVECTAHLLVESGFRYNLRIKVQTTLGTWVFTIFMRPATYCQSLSVPEQAAMIAVPFSLLLIADLDTHGPTTHIPPFPGFY